MTWNAPSAVTETLSIVFVGEVNGQPRAAVRAQATSPLSFSFDTRHDAGVHFGIHLHTVHRQDNQDVTTTQELRQEFNVAGSVY